MNRISFGQSEQSCLVCTSLFVFFFRLFGVFRGLYCSSVCCLVPSVLLFALSCSMARAERHRVVLVVCDRLTWEDVNAECPFLVGLMDRASVGLMNTAVAGPKNATSAALALAAGQTAASEPGDEQAFNAAETVGEEPGAAGAVWARRTGKQAVQGRTVVHINIASLTRRGLDTQTLGAILASANPPRRILVCGNADTDVPQRRAALFTLDAAGSAAGDVALTHPDAHSPFGVTDDVVTLARYAATTDADVFVAVLGDPARIGAARAFLTSDAYHAARRNALHNTDAFFLQLLAVQHLDTEQVDVLLISPCPPDVSSDVSSDAGSSGIPALSPAALSSSAAYDIAARPETWKALTPILAFGPDFAPGLLSSPTTRTPGLVANTDVAPTILRILDVGIPAVMSGRKMQSLPLAGGVEARQSLVSRLDYVTTLNADAQIRVAAPLSALCFVLVLCVILAANRCVRHPGAKRGARRLLPGVVFTLNLPTAMLLATLRIPPTLWEYGLRIPACMAALTLLDYALARLLRMPPPLMCSLFSLVVIVLDLLCGGLLLKDSLLSAYALSGIRYYGIGNEYLGAAMGYALLCGFLWRQGRGSEGQKRLRGLEEKRRQGDDDGAITGVIAGWLMLAFVMGWPGLGANAGSLIVTGAGAGVGAWMLSGRRFSVWVALACLLAGVGLSFTFGALDAHFGGAQASHAGNVLNAGANGRGAGYLADIMARKVGMNLRLLVSPFFVAAAGLIAILALLMRVLLGREIRALFAAHARLRQLLPTLAATLFASLVFKDSGVVTAGFVAGVACLNLLWYAVEAITAE